MAVFRCDKCNLKYDDVHGEHECPKPVEAVVDEEAVGDEDDESHD